jgi:hypothetical protein
MKNATIRVILSAAVMGLAGTAQAASWLEVGISTTGTKVAVDVESIRRDGGKVSVWVKYDYTKNASIKAREAKRLMKYDCDAQTATTLSLVSYDAQGGVISSETRAFSVPEPVVPESVGEAIMQVACADPTD